MHREAAIGCSNRQDISTVTLMHSVARRITRSGNPPIPQARAGESLVSIEWMRAECVRRPALTDERPLRSAPLPFLLTYDRSSAYTPLVA